MRPVILDDLLRVAAGLEGVPERDWLPTVTRWCEAAHCADKVRKRLGRPVLGPGHLGGRVVGAAVIRSDRGFRRRLGAALAGLELWQAAQADRGGRTKTPARAAEVRKGTVRPARRRAENAREGG
jgi:hypothetical protein